MGTMTFDDFTDLENREQEEENDALDTVVPPADIIACYRTTLVCGFI